MVIKDLHDVEYPELVIWSYSVDHWTRESSMQCDTWGIVSFHDSCLSYLTLLQQRSMYHLKYLMLYFITFKMAAIEKLTDRFSL